MDTGATSDELPATFHDRLYGALELMTEFFYSDGQGLSYDSIHSESFYRVEQRLQYHRTDTDKLIGTFYNQRLEEQNNITSSAYGVLAVRAYFNHDSLCVEVSVKKRFMKRIFSIVRFLNTSAVCVNRLIIIHQYILKYSEYISRNNSFSEY